MGHDKKEKAAGSFNI
jgi:hypothetical protein